MKVTTANPLTMAEIIQLTGKDALYQIGKSTCRIMNASPGQEIDVSSICYEPSGRKWGLRKVDSQQYKFLAFRIQ